MGNISAQDPQDFCRFCLNLSYMAVPLQVVQYNYAKIFVAGDVSLYKHLGATLSNDLSLKKSHAIPCCKS